MMNKIIFGSILFLIAILAMGCNSTRPTDSGGGDIYLTSLNQGEASRSDPFSLRDQLPIDNSPSNVSFSISNMTGSRLHFFDGSIVDVGKSIFIEGLDKVRSFLSALANGGCEGEGNGRPNADGELYLEAKVISCGL